jgi:Peptidase propeptide and YPEB domain
LEDITKVVEALRTAGCTALREIDTDSDGFEIEGATCNDGKSYDMKLDKKFAVVSKRKDWF